MKEKRLKGMREFYPFYLGEHRFASTRVMHFAGTTFFISSAIAAAIAKKPRYLAGGIFLVYGCAWIGHFFFEKNRPATFKYPLLSLISDFRFYRDAITGKEKIFPDAAKAKEER